MLLQCQRHVWGSSDNYFAHSFSILVITILFIYFVMVGGRLKNNPGVLLHLFFLLHNLCIPSGHALPIDNYSFSFPSTVSEALKCCRLMFLNDNFCEYENHIM